MVGNDFTFIKCQETDKTLLFVALCLRKHICQITPLNDLRVKFV
uniref:FERM domain-containing protein n=1 Tax=Mesocestoides corti TaxID=53468 RepID=A0A5K3G2L5_MESCO